MAFCCKTEIGLTSYLEEVNFRGGKGEVFDEIFCYYRVILEEATWKMKVRETRNEKQLFFCF